MFNWKRLGVVRTALLALALSALACFALSGCHHFWHHHHHHSDLAEGNL